MKEIKFKKVPPLPSQQTATEMLILNSPLPREDIPQWIRVIFTPIFEVIIWFKLRKRKQKLIEFAKTGRIK